MNLVAPTAVPKLAPYIKMNVILSFARLANASELRVVVTITTQVSPLGPAIGRSGEI